MTVIAFDTLAYVRRMEGVGFTREQAEAMAEEQAKLIDERLTTKTDLAAVEAGLKADLARVETALRADLSKVEAALQTDLAKVEAGLRSDLAKVEAALRSDLAKVEAGLKADIRESELRLENKIEAVKGDIAAAKTDLIKWVVGAVGFQTLVIVGSIIALVKMLHG